jgi:4-hydroxy 2-oxovalerate aldolase
MNKIKILDCTLRDGSYVLNFNFSLIDTFFISKALFDSGVQYVEIGHGLGLGISSKKNVKALHGDNEYIKVANSAKLSKNNKIGCFCFVDNIVKKNILDAKKNGLDFIRFAFDSKKISKLKSIINFCKNIGLEVHLNLIKTYKYSKKQILKIIKTVNKTNIDYLYIVDSAGGMDSEEIKNYIKILNSKLNKKISLGFHGHNNLGMANSNCITAINNGVKIIDSSMLGMGRGAGNANTEILMAYLNRKRKIKKYKLDINLRFIDNYLSKIFTKNLSTDEILIGNSYFHDSEINKLKKISIKNKLDYKKILLNTSFKKGISEKKILKKNLQNNFNIISAVDKFEIENKYINFQNSSIFDFKRNLNALQKKINSRKIITICRGKKTVFKIYNENGLVFGHIESSGDKEDQRYLKYFRDYYIFFDKNISKENYYVYSENEIEEKALLDIFNIQKFKFLKFIGKFNFKIKSKILSLATVDKKFKRGIYIVKDKIKFLLKEDAYIVLLCKNMNSDQIKSNQIIIKPNYGLVLSHEITRTLTCLKNFKNISKRIKISKNTFVIEKGSVGKENDIVVNSIYNPISIIGQSDGLGGIKNIIELKKKEKTLLFNWMYKSYFK